MYTITILMYLTLITMVGAYHMQKAAFRYLTRYVEKNSTPAPIGYYLGMPVYAMEAGMGGLDLDDHFIPDFLRHGLIQAEADVLDVLDDEYYAQQLTDSINTYEAEMDMEWEDEIMGYTLSDIVEFMVLDSDDDPYEDLPFTASMRRSAKVGKSGINYALNCGAERSIHNAGDKVRK
jgi:hypothetical protein